ncbi:MAG: YifB family Mg chelatase-like AAA ATPase [Clostridia bacterium]|nr:YifB family Mg chelatase-like AAA ATPase [Clostridia bacterium]
MACRFGKVRTCGLHGVSGEMLETEVVILPGLPSFDIVGLGDSAVKESRDRIRAAIRSSGYEFPPSRIIASLAPAWVRKEGSAFDLPIALSLLAACGVVRRAEWNVCLFGELSLAGEVRPVPGAIGRALTARSEGVPVVILPWGNHGECGMVDGIRRIPVRRLSEAVDYLNGEREADEPAEDAPIRPPPACVADLSSISGQDLAKRALLLAAAGWHNLLLLGSPGCGKSSLASAMPGILPPLDREERLEVAGIHSAAGLLAGGTEPGSMRPFRHPHHTATRAALLGGGTPPRPGEISLAHRGVLFLDEMTGFETRVLDVLRQPVEEHRIRILHAGSRVSFPSDFLLLAAANPCRCGRLFEGGGCRCTDEQVRQHMSRIGGPLLDRFDLRVPMTAASAGSMRASLESAAESESDRAKARVAECWAVQDERCRRHGFPPSRNGRMPAEHMREVLELDERICTYAAGLADGRLSTRGYHRMLRVARTLADLDGDAAVLERHVQEAYQYRSERTGGG